MSVVTTAFQEKFNSWVDQALLKTVPETVIAFSFNLGEPWNVELVGSDRYSDSEPDWACPPEAFRSKIKKFKLEKTEVGTNWQMVLDATKSMISSYLKRQSPGSDRLKRAVAVVFGFVDGDLIKVWPD